MRGRSARSRRARSDAGRRVGDGEEALGARRGSKSASIVATAAAGSVSSCASAIWVRTLGRPLSTRFSIISRTRSGSIHARVGMTESPAKPAHATVRPRPAGPAVPWPCARSSARVSGGGSDFGIDSGGSSTRASRTSTRVSPGSTIAPPNRNPAFSANTKASPLGTPASRNRPSASVVVAVRLGASPDWKTEAPATPVPLAIDNPARDEPERLRPAEGEVREA